MRLTQEGEGEREGRSVRLREQPFQRAACRSSRAALVLYAQCVFAGVTARTAAAESESAARLRAAINPETGSAHKYTEEDREWRDRDRERLCDQSE
ncbi:hypothetical protein GQ42DRAFT_34728 [Ramicandelaber brevisporus]|nr:hypothetical protein GQ42DRAFT_34728 [Ramicandelaber brevisporus]